MCFLLLSQQFGQEYQPGEYNNPASPIRGTAGFAGCRNGSLLLTSQAIVVAWRLTLIGTVRVDIQTAATGIAGINGQQFRLTVFHQVSKNTLNTLFIELIVVTE